MHENESATDLRKAAATLSWATGEKVVLKIFEEFSSLMDDLLVRKFRPQGAWLVIGHTLHFRLTGTSASKLISLR
jgi:hypothetical protein